MNVNSVSSISTTRQTLLEDSLINCHKSNIDLVLHKPSGITEAKPDINIYPGLLCMLLFSPTFHDWQISLEYLVSRFDTGTRHFYSMPVSRKTLKCPEILSHELFFRSASLPPIAEYAFQRSVLCCLMLRSVDNFDISPQTPPSINW